MDEKESCIVILAGETPIGKSIIHQQNRELLADYLFNYQPAPVTLKDGVSITGVFPKERVVVLKQGIYDCHRAIIGEITKTVKSLFKDKAYEGCRTPEPFRNDKGIYRQHKRQRKHK